jgi:hypothetical protein
LIGFIILMMNGLIWPGILLLMGLSSFAKERARGRADRAFGKLLLLGGLTLLFWTHTFWPGILLLMFVMWAFGR